MWRWRIPNDECCRRACGRSRYNRRRQFLAVERRVEVIRLLRQFGMMKYGTLTAIAKLLGVSVATICRDRQRLLRDPRPTNKDILRYCDPKQLLKET
jgi:hypothetical protein